MLSRARRWGGPVPLLPLAVLNECTLTWLLSTVRGGVCPGGPRIRRPWVREISTGVSPKGPPLVNVAEVALVNARAVYCLQPFGKVCACLLELFVSLEVGCSPLLVVVVVCALMDADVVSGHCVENEGTAHLSFRNVRPCGPFNSCPQRVVPAKVKLCTPDGEFILCVTYFTDG
jgi:hypothetical protein